MEKAFKTLGEHFLAATEHLHADWILQKEYPLSEKLLALSRVWRSPNGRDYVIAAKGAPEAIADLCHLSAGHQTALERHISTLTVMRRVTTALIVGASSYFYPIPIRDFSISHSLSLIHISEPTRLGMISYAVFCLKKKRKKKKKEKK